MYAVFLIVMLNFLSSMDYKIKALANVVQFVEQNISRHFRVVSDFTPHT